MRIVRLKAAGVAAIVALLLSLAGCGGGGDEQDSPAAALPGSDGVLSIADLETFEYLAVGGSSPVVRFVLFDLDMAWPGVYFVNTRRHPTLASFLEAVGLDGNDAGVLTGDLSYDPDLLTPAGWEGVCWYRLDEVLPSHDAVRVYAVLEDRLPVLDDNLAYYLPGYQLAQVEAELPLLRESHIDLVFDEDLPPEAMFVALSLGEGYGVLRVLEPGGQVGPRDVLIYEVLPAGLPEIAGLIGTVGGVVNQVGVPTELPHAFIRGALANPEIAGLIGSLVHYEVSEDGWALRVATQAEEEAHRAPPAPIQQAVSIKPGPDIVVPERRYFSCPEADSVSAPVDVAVTAVPIVVTSTTADYFVLYVKHDVDGVEVELPVSVTLGGEGTTTLADNVVALPKERYRVRKFCVANPADVDGDGIDDITELGDPVGMNPVNPTGTTIELDYGAVAIPDRQTFETLSYDSSGVEHLKFIVLGMDTDTPRLYFTNTNAQKYHGQLLDTLGLTQGPGFIRGDIIYDPKLTAPDGSQGLYRYTISRNTYTDYALASLSDVARAYTLLAASMPLLDNNLAYWIHNRGLQQFQLNLSSYQASRIPLVFDDGIFVQTSFQALNPGEGYGLLRSLDPDDRPNPRDVVLYETLPNELPRVAGIISTVPQTPLSHVNLRAAQDAIPNAFIRGASTNDIISPLIGNYVRYTVTEDGWQLRDATVAEVTAHYNSSRPANTQTPQRDLSVTTITALSAIDFDDWDAFGVKAANVAVLGKRGFPAGTVPTGFAIPFYFYDEFMKHNNLYNDITEMLDDADFQSDFDKQEDELKKLRKKIKDGEVPDWITTALTTMHDTYPDGQSLRYRSSTNNEDLPGFNGAGLYDSKTQNVEETAEDGITKSLKQVYASLWNFRAFSEREFHRVDHSATAMGVLVHPNYTDESVNGVAVSLDPAYGTVGTYYVNSQVGEDLVTNPEAHSVPEELLLRTDGSYTVVATSNLAGPGELLMSDAQLQQLGRHLRVIHDHFKTLYSPAADEPFAMEIEFKITSTDILAIKQARPWIFTTPPATDTSEGNTTNTLTANFDNPPATHDGNAFSVQLRFSHDLFISYLDFRDYSFVVTSGVVTSVRRLQKRNDLWEIVVTPDSNADVELVLAGNRPCTVPGAICTISGERLSTSLKHVVTGPDP